jgi:hypothetical protein
MERNTPAGELNVIWEVFYSPHTDDESIGMAGAIIRAKERGHAVLLVLVTDNVPSRRIRSLFPGIDTYQERIKEFARAAEVLQVNEIHAWEVSEARMGSEPNEVRQEIFERMVSVHASRTVVHHHTTWGLWDANQGIACIAHGLCADAATLMAQRFRVSVSLHGIYEYSKSETHRSAPMVWVLSERESARKRVALDCYKVGSDSIGYGYASVRSLIDAAQQDPREFTIEVTHGNDSAE